MIKTSIVLLAGLLAAAALRRRSAALRHWVLTCSMAAAALLPVMERISPAWTVPSPAFLTRPAPAPALQLHETDAALGAVAAPAPVALASRTSWLLEHPLDAAWIVGTLAGLAWLAANLWRLVRLAGRAAADVNGHWQGELAALAGPGAAARIRLLRSDHPAVLFTFGLRTPTIVLPRGAQTWPVGRVRAVLEHELAHVRRRDWFVQVLAEVVRCAHWFNPLAWLACSALRRASEQACDDVVLAANENAPEYAARLLEVAREFQRAGRLALPVMTAVRPSNFERRVRTMLTPGIDRSPVTGSRGLGIAVLVLLAAMPLAALTVGQPAAGPVSATAAARPSPAPVAAVPSPSRPDERVVEPARPAGRLHGEPAAQPRPAVPSGSVVVVTDQFRKPMAGVEVVITRGAARSPGAISTRLETGADGRAEATGLPDGDYDVSCSRPGFKRARLTLPARAGKRTATEVVMAIGSLAETVTVTSDPSPAGAAALAPPAPRRIGSAPTTPDPCEGSSAGGCVTPPRKLVDMKPVYPAALAASGATAVVVVKAIVGTDGSLTDAKAEPGPEPAFIEAALAALDQWKFSSLRLDGIPLTCEITVTVEFSTNRR